jgi:hypothetical protein
MATQNTGKKHSVIRDELKLKGGGLYCFLPFNRIDKNKKAVFKIGLAINFTHRTEQYHTYFPNGVYMIAFLENPPVPRTTRTQKGKTKKEHYLAIEKYIFKHVLDNGAKRIHSTTRSRNPNENKEGETEWVYTDEETVHEAFTDAKSKYGGNLKLFYLEGLDPDTNEFTSINQIANEEERSKEEHYTGKIIYFV